MSDDDIDLIVMTEGIKRRRTKGPTTWDLDSLLIQDIEVHLASIRHVLGHLTSSIDTTRVSKDLRTNHNLGSLVHRLDISRVVGHPAPEHVEYPVEVVEVREGRHDCAQLLDGSLHIPNLGLGTGDAGC